MGPRASITIVLSLVLCSVLAIRVPVDWNSDSAVKNEKLTQDVEIFGDSKTISSNTPVSIPEKYFQYPAKKPEFAVDVAKFHGVNNPERHYSAYPINPYTGKEKLILGKHKILDDSNPVFHQFQKYTKINEDEQSSVSPTSTEYEVFHPYKAEEPALQEIYKDPVLDKIRNDIYNSQSRLQQYEKDAGEPDIQDGEYLENPEQTERKKFPIKNSPVPYETHRPQRRPIYYRPVPYTSRDHYLNKRFRHPWNQYNAKIRPVHYRPLKNHLQRLRQNHAVKYDDERNEYPQVPTLDQISETPDGYDIYERGKAKYLALKNNVDESINQAVQENRPAIYQRLELQNNGDRTETQITDDDQEFVPIKNYAQVRKTETTKHLPKDAAFEDASSLDEIKNAPRLREAIKSTKAQTVYTEEGYEDAAYDHEGEEKHAAENEAHGGYLTEKEKSEGKFKTPSVNDKYQDANGNVYRDQNLHGEKWENNNKDKVQETEEEDYSEDDIAHSVEADVYDDVTGGRDKRQNNFNVSNNNNESRENEETVNEGSVESTDVIGERSKRENKYEVSTPNKEGEQNDSVHNYNMKKLNTNFKVPVIYSNSTYLSAKELAEKIKIVATVKKDNIKQKYPYYFSNLRNINRHSPLRYAENLKFIPKKSKGGTEFYDSRSKILECPEVDDDVDAIPEKLKTDGHPDENHNSNKSEKQKGSEADFSQIKKNRRLQGLGDKIDCFKTKFFGENPLDSPFFKEDIISNPEPITAPNLPAYKVISKEPLSLSSSLSNSMFNNSKKLELPIPDFGLSQNLQGEQFLLKDALIKSTDALRSSITLPRSVTTDGDKLSQKTDIYEDTVQNINSNMKPEHFPVLKQFLHPVIPNLSDKNITTESHQKDVKVLPTLRNKRAAPFVYEPYKIIRDGQLQESKKTTTTSNISPLIKQLQSSKIIDRVTKSSEEKDQQPVKRNVSSRTYKDIGRSDRVNIANKGAKDTSDIRFVDVRTDPRRGEPLYEIRLPNHKSEYVPVNNKKSMSLADYEAQTNKTLNETSTKHTNNKHEKYTTAHPVTRSTKSSRQTRPTNKPFFDVSKYIPKSELMDVQEPLASNTVRKVIKATTPAGKRILEKKTDTKSDDNEEDYEEYDDEKIITTSTSKPSFQRRRIITTTTTLIPEVEEPELPKLRLITRFNTTPTPNRNLKKETIEQTTVKSVTEVPKETYESASPKYREKKKKSSKSTLVTDTKTYGDGDDDMMKDEVDALIGVQQDMEEYKPQYEKEMEREKKYLTSSDSSEENESDDDISEEDDEELDDEDDDESDSYEEGDSESSEIEPETTTNTSTKQTLSITTQSPVSTTESRSAKLELRNLKPIIHKKKIEIHEELPVKKSSPHITQFKQDFKEVEIIKEMPMKIQPKSFKRVRQRKPQKNLEALELYKDEKLAEEINKLGAVEVFKQNLDLVKGPRHGGNYRSAQLRVSSTPQPLQKDHLKIGKDADTSQSRNEKLVEIAEVLPARRANGRNLDKRSRNNEKNASFELEESTETPKRKMHGGNLKSIQDIIEERQSNKNSKLIELDEDDDDKSSDDTHDDNYQPYEVNKSNSRPLHGGNYRSAKIVEDISEEEFASIKKKATTDNNHRSKSADLLSSLAQAVPHLTTTPAYILDPSKRMYYYVDAKR